MKQEIKLNLQDYYDNYLYNIDPKSEIHFRNKLVPREKDKRCSTIAKNGKSSYYAHLSEIETEVYDVVENAIRHRTPSDPKIEEYSCKVSSVETLRKEAQLLQNGKDYIPIIFEGKKGSGKTTSLNLFTKECNDNFKEDKVLIVRGNAEEYQRLKIQNFKIDPDETNMKMSISDYMHLRLAYLMVNHIEEEQFQEIYKNICWEECDVLNNPYRKKQNSSLGTVNDLVEYVQEQLRINNHDGHGSAYGFEIHKMLKKSLALTAKGNQGKGLNDWIELALQIVKYCEKNQIKIINVFDGIDNVYSFTKETKKAFNSMVSDISDLFIEATGNNIFIHYIVACRPETTSYIRASINDGRIPCPIQIISHEDREAQAIFTKKMLLVNEGLEELQQGDRFKNNPEAKLLISNFLNSDYILFVEKLKNEISLDSRLEVFSYNVRSFLYNYIAFVLTKTFFIKERSGSTEIYEEFSELTYYTLFIKNLFSGGRSLVETSEMLSMGQAKYAVVLPNPFSYPYSSNKIRIKDHILSSIRVLKAFDLDDEVMPTSSEIIKFVCNKFGYENEIIEALFERLVQFRMIEREDGEFDKDRILYKTTKGKNVLFHVLFKHPEILTWLAFDATLSKNTWEMISNGDNLKSFDMINQYISIVTVLTIRFIAYLNYVSDAETRKDICDFSGCLNSMTQLLYSSIKNEHMSTQRFKTMLKE